MRTFVELGFRRVVDTVGDIEATTLQRTPRAALKANNDAACISTARMPSLAYRANCTAVSRYGASVVQTGPVTTGNPSSGK